MTQRSLHFALLVCDTPLPEVVAKYGDYTQQFPVIFERASASKNVRITWDFFEVVKEQAYPSLEDIENKKYDAIVITGSKYDAHDDLPWILKMVEFLQAVLKKPEAVKLVGFCFGHQLILRAAGGVTERNPKGWEVGHTELELTEEGKEFLKTDKKVLVKSKMKKSKFSKI